MLSAMELIYEANLNATPQTAKTLSAEDVAIRRKFCDWLALWRDCDTAVCRRTHGCAGDPTPCFARFWASSPESTRIWAAAGMLAVEEGCTARGAAREADAVVLMHLKKKTRLPLSHGRHKRTV